MRFHPTRGSMTVSEKDGGLPPDSVVQDDDTVRGGPVAMTPRDALDLATRGGAACLGRTGEIGELTVGAFGDLVVWASDQIAHAGAMSDPVDGWLRCGPGRARETVVAGRVLVEAGRLTLSGVDDVVARHRAIAARLQNVPIG